MKAGILCCFVAGYLHSTAQQSTIKGVVSIQNSETQTGKRQYVSNAQVEDDFGKATPRVTDDQGQFGLVYVGVAEKSSVSFQVKKPGLQVVDPTSLSAVAGQHAVVKITMANPDSIAEYRRRIFKVGKTEAEKRLESLVQSKSKELADARKNVAQNAGMIKKLEESLSALEMQRQKIVEQAEELARKYAPVNLDDASGLFRNAFVLYQRGNFDSAYLLLQQANLSGMIDSILIERDNISLIRKDIQKRDSVEKQRTSDAAEALQLKADLHKTRHEFDSAAYCYELLIKLDTSTGIHLIDYSKFLSWLNRLDNAVSYGLRALEVYNRLAKDNPQTYAREKCIALEHLGAVYWKKKDYPKAEAADLEALETCRQLEKEHSKIYMSFVASIQDNLGILYLSQKDYDKAELALLKALEITEQLGKDDPEGNELPMAHVQNSLGGIYMYKKEYDKAEASLLVSLDIYKRLAGSSPQIYMGDLAVAENNLGNLYDEKKDIPKAQSAYLAALDIRKQLAKDNPQTYEPGLALTENNLGVFYNHINNYDQSEKHLLAAFNIREKWMAIYPQIYRSDLLKTATSLVDLYYSMADSLEYDAINTAEKDKFKLMEDKLYALAKLNYAPLSARLSSYYGSRSYYLLLASRFGEAVQSATKGLELDSSQVWLKTNLAHALLLENKYDQAFRFYQELKPLKDEEGKSYAVQCLADLDELEKKNITNKDFSRIRAFLMK